MIRAAEHSGAELQVMVEPGARELSNLTALRRSYGDTRLQVIFADGLVRVTKLKDMLWRGKPPAHQHEADVQYEAVRRIDILRVKRTAASEQALSGIELAEHIGRHPNSARSIAHTINHKELVSLYGCASRIRDRRIRQRAEGQLVAISKKRFGISLRLEPSIAYPASVHFPKHLIRRAGAQLLRGITDLPAAPLRRLVRKLRVVRSRPSTPGRILGNFRPACADYDPDQPPRCE